MRPTFSGVARIALDAAAPVALEATLPIVFAAIAAELFEGRADVLPWLVAATVAVVTADRLPGYLHVLAGALAGAGTAVIRGDG